MRRCRIVLRNWSLVRLGSTREARALFFKLRHVQARVASGRTPAGHDAVLDRAAAALNVDRAAVGRMDAVLRGGDLSLNRALAESEDDILTLLADDRPGPEAQAIAADLARARNRMLDRALAALSPRERGIVLARRLSDEAPTLKEIGRKLGITTERVRQIEHAAVGKMRAALGPAERDCLTPFDDHGTVPHGTLAGGRWAGRLHA